MAIDKVRWSPREEAMLIELYGHDASSVEMCDVLGRSKYSILGKAAVMHITNHKGMKKCRVNKLSIEDSAYLAGFIDGEGTISLQSRTGRNYPRPVVQLSSTSKDEMEELKSVIGTGSLYGRHRYVDTHKPELKLEMTSFLDKRELLIQILPYLRLKKEQAIAVLEFIQRRMDNIPLDERDNELHMKVKEMNRRGG